MLCLDFGINLLKRRAYIIPECDGLEGKNLLSHKAGGGPYGLALHEMRSPAGLYLVVEVRLTKC